MQRVSHVIDGAEVDTADGGCFTSMNPWTREPWTEVALGTPADVQAAVDAARRAFDGGPWPRMGRRERARILHRFADMIIEHADELADADARDMGKPVSDSTRVDVPRAADYLRDFADHARIRGDERFPNDDGHHIYTSYEPAGVVAAITPWNYPVLLQAWKFAPALAWGNTVVLKPSETAPASATRLACLAAEAGLPAGALNVVHGTGGDGAGEWLVSSEQVDRISFTGGSVTGQAVMAAAARNLTPVSLELGGKGANLVFEDVDLDSSLPWLVGSAFANSGQLCLAGSRLLVHSKRYEEVVDRLASVAAQMEAGDPIDRDTRLGPLASEGHFEKVTSYLKSVREDGGTIVTGGVGDGWVVRPSVITDLAPDARVCSEEVFGPLVTVTPFDEEDEAVSLANSTPYGLTAAVFTENLRRAHRVGAALRAGTVWVNCFFARDTRQPFGGMGRSGVGREGGDHSRQFHTEPKSVVISA